MKRGGDACEVMMVKMGEDADQDRIMIEGVVWKMQSERMARVTLVVMGHEVVRCMLG